MFHDCATHDLDMVCWILGEYPTSVYTQAHAHIKEVRETVRGDVGPIDMWFDRNIWREFERVQLDRNGALQYQL